MNTLEKIPQQHQQLCQLSLAKTQTASIKTNGSDAMKKQQQSKRKGE